MSAVNNVDMRNILDELELLGQNFTDLGMLITQFLQDNRATPDNVNRDRLVALLIVLRDLAKQARDVQGEVLELDAEAFMNS